MYFPSKNYTQSICKMIYKTKRFGWCFFNVNSYSCVWFKGRMRSQRGACSFSAITWGLEPRDSPQFAGS